MKSLIGTYSILGGGGGVGMVAYLLSRSGREVGWAGRLFEAGRLLTFLPLGWALIRINTGVRHEN